MSDGAHYGVSAEDAMRAAIGGVQPTHFETAAEMSARILAATYPPHTYDEAATYAAKLILTSFLADPALTQVPTEGAYEKDADGQPVWNDKGGLNVVERGLYAVLKDDPTLAEQLEELGLSGFQWGWAVNAARRCVELGPVPNPAIITIGSER